MAMTLEKLVDRSVLTRRLSNEGRWEEANRYKLVCLQVLEKAPQSRGLCLDDRLEMAWRETEKAFPPKKVSVAAKVKEVIRAEKVVEKAMEPVVEPSVVRDELPPDLELEDFGTLFDDGGKTDLNRDALWVYEHFRDRAASPTKAPSQGAWNMLQWARVSKNRFFEVILPKVKTDGQEGEVVKSERKALADIQGILDKLREGK